MSAMPDASLVAFEEWAISEGMPLTMSQGTPDDLEATAFCWKCWQASRKQALEEAAKVCETQLDQTRPNTTSGYAYWHAKQIKELLK